MSHDHYIKDVRHLSAIDVYRVLDLFGVAQPAIQHAIKKLLCAGKRGAKDYRRDLKEALDSIDRALQMDDEDAGARMQGLCQKLKAAEPAQRGYPEVPQLSKEEK